MRHLPLLLLAFAIVPSALATTPVEAATLALRDVKTLPPDQQQNTAYFWAGSIEDGEREKFFKVFVFHINSLSREADLAVPVRVAPDVWRCDIRDFGWQKAVFNKLAQVDPYFHAKLQVALVPAVIQIGDSVETVERCDVFDENIPQRVRGWFPKGTVFDVLAVQAGDVLAQASVGKVWVPSRHVRKVTIAQNQKIDASAPWLPAKEMAELIALTQNEAPILRADWFFAETSRPIGRNGKANGANYYDFLGLKNQKDAENLAGLDRDKAKKIQREIAAIVAESGVTLNNRQIFRFGTIAGGWWETRDVEESTDRKNAIRQLDDDFGPPDALEVYFHLPNRLWGLLALNNKGELQATVPDKIASDNKSTSRDTRIAPSISCVRCHVEGLRPIDDWGRTFYSAPPGDAKLTSIDYEKLKRLRRLYLAPMEDDLNADMVLYSRALQRLTGFKPAEAAKAYAAAYQIYVDTSVGGESFARELGISYQNMIDAFKAYAKTQGGNLDPVLIGFLKRPEFRARREHIEEIYPLAQQAILSYRKPP